MNKRNRTENDQRIALGLVLAARHAQRGVCMSPNVLAAWCGCSRAYIRQIESRAITKLRKLIQP